MTYHLFTTANDIKPDLAYVFVGVIYIVIGCLATVFVVVIGLFVVIKYHRYRQRYSQHELLINNEGTDGDLDAPMLDG